MDGLFVETSPQIRSGEEVWGGLLKVAALYGKQFDVLIQHKGIRGIKARLPIIQMDFIHQSRELELSLKKLFLEGKRVLIHGPTGISWPDIDAIAMKKKILVISQQIFVVHPSEEKQLVEACPNEKDRVFHKSCQALHLSRRSYRKKLERNRMSAALERFKSHSLTLFIHEP